MRLLFKYAINKMGSRDLSGGFILSVLQQEKSEAENIVIRYIHIKDEFEMSELMSESVSESMSERCLKPLPIGFSDYIRTQSEYYYVDKILLIKEFLAQNAVCARRRSPMRFTAAILRSKTAAHI